MKIAIKNKKGEVSELEINSDTSIKDLKIKIFQASSIPINQQHLIFRCLTLKDEQTLKDYFIQDKSTILLIDKKNSLLLQSSNIFTNSDLIDHIRQSYIDLKNKPLKEDVINLLIEAISYLDEKLDFSTASELISLIVSCFSNYPEDSFKIFKNRYETSKISSLHMITLSSILANFVLNTPQIPITDYHDFITNSITEIIPQIQNNIINIKVNGIDIIPEFKTKFITNLIFAEKLTEQIITTFYSFFTLKEADSFTINKFIQKVQNDRLLQFLPESYFFDDNLYLVLNDENMLNFISIISEQNLNKILVNFEGRIKNSGTNTKIVNAIVNKCIEYDISFDYINSLINYYDDFKSVLIWNYFSKNNIKISSQFFKMPKIEKQNIPVMDYYPKTALLLKCIINLESLPKEYITYALLNAESLDIYDVAFSSDKIENEVISTFEFWKHILSIVRKSRFTDFLVRKFAFYFKKYLKIDQSTQMFDKLIFDHFPPNEMQSQFLISLLKNLPKDYIYDYHNFAHESQLASEFIKRKEVPSASCVSLFNLKSVWSSICNQELEMTPLLLYNLSFTTDKPNFIKEVTIMKKTHELSEILIDFISQRNNYDLITNIDEESLSLIACSLFFVKSIKLIDVKGLTVENILPFYSIILNVSNSNVNRTTKEMLDLLIESLNYLNKNPTPLLLASINSIVLNLSDLNFLKTYWSDKIYLFIETLLDSFLKGTYKGDKLILIKTIFTLSHSEHKSAFYLKILPDLFKLIIQNISEINNNKLFNKSFLDLNSFSRLKVSKTFVDIIEKSTSYEPIIELIYFIKEKTSKCPTLKFESNHNLNTAFQKAIYDNKWDDVQVIIEFMKKNYLQIDYDYLKGKKMPVTIFQSFYNRQKLNNIDDIITFYLCSPQIDMNDRLMRPLFGTLMCHSFIATKYIRICLEKITVNQVFSPEVLFTKFIFLNYEYKKDLVNTINCFYKFSKEKKIFIRKIDSVRLILPEPNFQFLNRLIDQKTFQSFACLQNIASCFPFLFEPFENEVDSSHSLVAVNIVLPVLNSVSKIFEDQISPEIMDELKTAFAAISFLFACLYSTKFLSIFTLWLFENFTKLSDSQVFCFSHILISLFKTETVNQIIFAYAFKYDFFDILAILMNRKVENIFFQQFYDSQICKLIEIYFSMFSTIRNKGNATYIQLIKDDKIQNPFEKRFNNFMTISPIILKPIEFTIFGHFKYSKKLNKLSHFLNTINQEKRQWISYNLKNVGSEFNIVEKEIDRFLTSFDDQIHSYINEPPIILPKKINVEMHSLILNHPLWAINFIENQFGSEILPKIYEYRRYLTDLLEKVNLCKKTSSTGKKIPSFRKSIDGYKLFEENVYSNSIFGAILKKKTASYCCSKNNIADELIIKLFYNSTKFVLYLVQYISDYISKGQISSQILQILCQILCQFWKNDVKIESCFLDNCAQKIIDISLSDLCRTNEKLLEYIANILVLIKSSLPIRVTHVIGIIFAHHPKLTNLATELYLKIGDKDSVNVFPIIQMRYKKDVDEKIPDFNRIKIYIENFPTLAKSCFSASSILLEKAFFKLKEEKFNNVNLQELIIELFNKAAPEPVKITNNNNNSSHEQNNDDLLYPVPDYIKQTSPLFWENFYEKNRPLLNEMIKKNSNIFNSLYFLFDYIELLSFKLRYLYFRKSMDSLIKNRYSNFVMKVSRSKILLDSFGYWCSKTPKELLTPFRIIFDGEEGYDQGGLTREWFTYLIKELFDPKLGLFLKSEKQKYYFNPSTLKNYINIECLKMTGGIIALSLIRDINVNIHLSSSLLKQLLHQEIQLEDIKDFDESLFISFQSILESKDVKPLDLVFSINEIQKERLVSVDLIENGEKTEVTNENKNEYVKLYVNYKLQNCVNEQIKAFCEGFESFIDPKYIKMFSTEELDLIICGNKTIDVNDMKKNVVFNGNYHKDHPVIVMFFNVISKWSQENLSKLIQFITGSSQVGVNGFESFKSSGNSITISSLGSKSYLPVAHTCSNRLDLPEYDNEKDMNDKLLLAIQECQFGLT